MADEQRTAAMRNLPEKVRNQLIADSGVLDLRPALFERAHNRALGLQYKHGRKDPE